MENNLAELKEKFIERFVQSKDSDGNLYWKYCRVEEVFSWIAENTVPKSEHEATKQALSKLQLQYLEANEQIEQLKAENEKYKKYIDELVEEARQEERARIVAQIQETAKKFYAINPLVLADEFIKAITADQPAQKSCEGCEHYFNIEENPFIICEFSCKYYSYYKSKEK